jgi:hypothetical protein
MHAPNHPVSDFLRYHRIATALAGGHEAPLYGFQGMGYPKILSTVYRGMREPTQSNAQGLNVALSVAALLIGSLVIVSVRLPKLYQIAGVSCLALMPQLIAYCSVTGTETLAALLLGCMTLGQIVEDRPVARYALMGVSWGILSLVRPMFLPYLAVVCLADRLTGNTWSRTIRNCAITLLAGMIVMLPWTVQSLVEAREVTPLSYNAGFVLHSNNNPLNVDGRYMDVDTRPAASIQQEQSSMMYSPITSPGANRSELHDQDSRYKTDALVWIRTNPLEFLKLGLLRVANTFFGGAPDLTWSMMDLDETAVSLSTRRSINVMKAMAGALTSLLAGANFVLLFVSLRAMFQGLMQPLRMDYLTLLPSLGFLFLVSTVFIFEGQPRYVVPFYLLMLVGALRCTHLLNTRLVADVRRAASCPG